MSATGLHDNWLLRIYLIQIRLGDVFLVFNPSCGYIDLLLRVLCNKLLNNLTVFGVVSFYTNLSEVSLSDKAVAGEVAVTV